MAFTGTDYLNIIEIIIYLIIFPITIYLGFRHGKAGFLGYFYLNVACTVRIVADIVSLLPANRDAASPTIASIVLSSIGLSPLLLALSGFLHEAHVRLVTVTHSFAQLKKTKRWLWFIQIQIHGTAVLGMVLAIIAGIKLYSAQTTLTADEAHTDEKLRSAGTVILFVVWAFMFQYSFYLVYIAQQVRVSSSGNIDVLPMVAWIKIALVFAGLRCVSLLIYAFDKADTQFNPITGALWVKVIFVFLATLGAVAGMCISGWVSRNIARHPALKGSGGSRDVTYEQLRPEKAYSAHPSP